MKRLYVLSGCKPSERAQAILFDDNPPEDSSAAMVKELAKAENPVDQAKIIVANKVPYRVASTVITAMSPPVIAALIEVMSPQELINNIGSLTKRGAMENADLKALISEKLKEAKTTTKRVAALKSLEAVKALLCLMISRNSWKRLPTCKLSLRVVLPVLQLCLSISLVP